MANMCLGYNSREFRNPSKPSLGPNWEALVLTASERGTHGWWLTPRAHFLTIALASSRMDGMERMLYRAPFTYGCIFKGRKQTVMCEFSNTIQFNYHTPPWRAAWLLRRVTTAICTAPWAPNDRHLRSHVAGQRLQLRVQSRACTIPSHSLLPAAFHCLIDVFLTTQARTPGGILDSSRLPLQYWVSKSSLMGTLPVNMRCHSPCSDVLVHDLGYIESPKGSLRLYIHPFIQPSYHCWESTTWTVLIPLPTSETFHRNSLRACSVASSRVRLFATPWIVSPPGSSVHGILQARILEWAAMPSSRGSSRPREWPASPALRQILYCWGTGEGP